MGFLDSLFGGASDSNFAQTTNYSKGQENFMTTLLSLIIPTIGSGTGYSGDLASKETGLQTSSFDFMKKLLSGTADGQDSATNLLESIMGSSSESGSYLETLMQPWDKTLATDTWKKSVYDVGMDSWKNDILPSIQEKFAAYDAAGGGGSAKAITDAGAKLDTLLNANLAETLLSDKSQSESTGSSAASNLLSSGNTAVSNLLNEFKTLIQGGSTLGSQQYDVAQNLLTGEYEKWETQQPWNNKWLQYGMKLMGTPFYTSSYDNSTGILGSMLNPCGSSAGKSIGSSIGSKMSSCGE